MRLWRHEGTLTAAAVADRVRWQLDGWLHASGGGRPSGGLVRLALVPDEVVAATGRQLGFWGGETEADERAARALTRVQALLGVEAVQVPERRGGRGPAEQIRLVPAAAVDVVARAVGAAAGAGSAGAAGAAAAVAVARGEPPPPWPGRLPAPAPARVHAGAAPAEVLDARGRPVVVTGRGEMVAPPAVVVVGGTRVEVAAWAGPWPVEERWWDRDAHRRLARVQVLGADGSAWLLVRELGAWHVEATYD